MSEPFIGEIKIFPYNFAPRNWAQCDGQSLAIAQNQALFSLLGTTYGGNGTTNFLLPNLKGRVPVHRGSNYVQGQVGGSENVTLLSSQIPSHIHTMSGTDAAPTVGPASGASLATFSSGTPYAPTSNASMSPTAASGGSQSHSNLQPYTVLNFCIALVGIFPSRN